jgi:hypothetical protein
MITNSKTNTALEPAALRCCALRQTRIHEGATED